jgi:hypothetical protein
MQRKEIRICETEILLGFEVMPFIAGNATTPRSNRPHSRKPTTLERNEVLRLKGGHALDRTLNNVSSQGD